VKLRPHLPALGIALLVYGLALAARLFVLHAQMRANGGELPFTRESAIQWWMTREVHETGQLPSPTRDLMHPEELDLAQIHSVGSEWAYAAIARLLPAGWPLELRVRYASVGLFCLVVPLLSLLARTLSGGSLAAQAVAGLTAAVAAANVARSSGVELSRENFALPFFVAFLWCEALATRPARSPLGRWLCAAWAAAAAAVAVCTWDMVLIGLWAWWARRAWGWSRQGEAAGPTAPLLAAALLLAGWANPYLRAHGFWHGALPLALVGLACSARGALTPGRRWLPWAAALAAGVLNAALDDGRYGHFGSLLAAKIRFFNLKPADPALLTFDQRMLWTPALNSSTWALTSAFFPFMLWPSLLGALACGWSRKEKTSSRAGDPAVFFLASLLAYVFFFRFHVFLILAAALVLADWAGRLRSWHGFRFYATGLVLSGVVVGETVHTLRKAKPVTLADKRALAASGQPVGRSGVEPFLSADPAQLRFQTELVTWLKAEHPGEPVLANFGISGPILAYAGCPVLLHPKFETKDIRERVREYAERLFRQDERALRDWAAARGARWLVFSIGEFSPYAVDQQLRYMVDALDPGPEVVARQLDLRVMDELEVMARRPRRLPWDHLRLFRLRWLNMKYAVFQIISPEDEEMAAEYLRLARLAARAGDWSTVVKRALAALGHDETLAEAFQLKALAESKLPQGSSD
jgi:hypothetical protein